MQPRKSLMATLQFSLAHGSFTRFSSFLCSRFLCSRPFSRILIIPFLLFSMIFLRGAGAMDIKTMPGVFKVDGVDRSCIKIGPKVPEGSKTADYSWVDGALNKTLQDLKNGVGTNNAAMLKPLFHPRLKVTTAAIDEVLSKQKVIVGKNFTTQIEQVWTVYNKDRKVDRLPCEDDLLQISPLYGYEYQISTWLQSTGEKEAGRLFVTLVPKDKTWYIGNFHWHQWTHKAKDYRNWTEEADGLFKNKNYLAAWVYYDLARKLLHGKTYFLHAGETIIGGHQKDFAPGTSWQAEVLSLFPSDKVVHVASALTTEGAGLLMRFAIDKELSAVDIRDHCRRSLRTLIGQPWFGPLSGIRCGYVLPREARDKDGVLGSLYMDRTALDK